jgi:integrase
MASLQARHAKDCPRGPWSKTKGAKVGCKCPPGHPLYVARYWLEGRNRQQVLGPNLKEAERELAAITQDVYKRKRGYRPQQDKDATFVEWSSRWLDEGQQVENTKRSYKPTFDYAKQAFGDRIVRTLDTDDVRDFLKLVKENGGNQETQARHLRVLGACLQAAVEAGYAERNAARFPKTLRPKRQKAKASYFTNAELAALWPKMPAELPTVIYTHVCKLAVTTGMRQGELLALRWGDVHELDKEIHVNRSYVAGIGLKTPKSGEGRTVDLTDAALKVLGEWTKLSGVHKAGDLVFPRPLVDSIGREREGGEFIRQSTLTRGVLYPAMTAAKIPREGERGGLRDFHSFRHTFARIALENGAEITWVQKQLGHSSITLTVDVYGSWARTAEKAQAEKLNGVFKV